jgi:hypothetical protein
MNQDQVKQNLLSPAQWLRILLMFGYLVALWVLSMVLLVIVITQTVITLIVGEANSNLRQFGVLLAEYVRQVINFVVYGTEERPFPFAPFPAAAVEPGATESLVPEPGVDRTEAAQPADPDAPPSEADLYGGDSEGGDTRDEQFRT